MRWYAIPAIAITSLLLACGGGNDEQGIRETAEGFVQALIDDLPKAYTYLAQECKDEISFTDFAFSQIPFKGLLGESNLKVKGLEIIEREDAEIVADFEIVIVADGEEIALTEEMEDEGPMRFVKEDGRWRFADCAIFGARGESGNVTPFIITPGPMERPTADAEADDDPTLPGEFVDLAEIYGGPYGNTDGPPTTALHVMRDIDYVADGNSNPPAGGPHWGLNLCPTDPDDATPFCGPVPWGIYREPWEPESLVHNMEHAGVVLWYNTTDQEIIDELEDLIGDRLNRGVLLVMAPYPDMEEEHIALTAWSRIDKFPVSEYSKDRVEEFIDAHERRFNPEDF